MVTTCGLDVWIQVDSLLPDRSYTFFSHTHKAQPENMTLLDKVLLTGFSKYGGLFNIQAGFLG